MENKINLNILGAKNFDDEKIEQIEKALNEIRIPYQNILKQPFQELERKIRIIKNKRKNSKTVWAKFTCSWSGYSNNPSAPRRTLGTEYRKLNREIAEKLPNYFCHKFTDGSTNDWNIKVVSVRSKKKSSSYGHQVDEFIKSLTQ